MYYSIFSNKGYVCEHVVVKFFNSVYRRKNIVQKLSGMSVFDNQQMNVWFWPLLIHLPGVFTSKFIWQPFFLSQGAYAEKFFSRSRDIKYSNETPVMSLV